MADLPASLAALLGLARGPSERVERGGTITLLTLPGRGLVGAAVTPSGPPLLVLRERERELSKCSN